jgi:hypothetical protein
MLALLSASLTAMLVALLLAAPAQAQSEIVVPLAGGAGD